LICACLPTLGPIFRRQTVSSMMGSFRSFFSLSSSSEPDKRIQSWRGTPLPDHQEHKSSTRRHYNSRPNLFYPLADGQELVTHVEGCKGDMGEKAFFPSERIVVESDVERQVHERSI